MGYRMDRRTNVIRSRGKQVGAVVKHAEGGYVGRIGKEYARGVTPEDAFRQVAARALGFSNAQELKQHNRDVRLTNKLRRRHFNSEMRNLLDGNFDGILDLIGGKR